MKLTQAQQFLLNIIEENHGPGLWPEVMRAERRTAEALARRGLIKTRPRGDGTLEASLVTLK